MTVRRLFHITFAVVAVMHALLMVAPARADDFAGLRADIEYARYAAAAQSAETLLAADPTLAFAWHTLGAARAASGDAEGAQQAWRRAAVLSGPGALSARVALARATLLAGNDTAARETLQQILADGRGVVRVDDLMAVAEAASLLGRYDPARFRDAVDAYQRAAEAAPELPSPQVALAGLLLDKYNNTEASALLQQTLARHPEQPRALLALARSLLFDHSDDYAAVLARCIAVAPGLVEAHTMAARARLDLGDLQAAEAAIDTAQSLAPDSREAFTGRAALAFLRNDTELMQEQVARALALAPGDASPWIVLAEVAAQQRRYAEAVYFARRAVRVDAYDWRGHGLLGTNAIRLGDMRLGRDSLERAFRGDPFNAWFKNTLDLLDELDGYDTASTGEVRLLVSPAQAAAVSALLLPLAAEAEARFVARYGHELEGGLRIEFYPEQAHLSVRTLGLVGTDLLGVSFGPVVALDSPSARPHSFNWGAVLWHETAHSFHLQISAHRAPRWFSEGLAVHEEHLARPGWGSDVDATFLIAFSKGELPPASRLDNSFLRPATPAALSHAYVQAGLLLEMIEEIGGVEAIRAMLQGFGDGLDTPALLETVLGLSPQALDRRFEQWLRTRYADVLAAMAEPGDDDNGGGRYVATLRAGWAALETGDLDTAESEFRVAFTLFPTHASRQGPLYGLSRVALERGDDLAAADWLRRLLAVETDELAPHLELAAVEERLGDRQAAARTLAASLYLQPFDASVRARLATHYEALGDWRLAARERAAVAALAPADTVVADYLHARALLRAGAPRAARAPLLRALEAAPLYEPALDLLLEMHWASADDG